MSTISSNLENLVYRTALTVLERNSGDLGEIWRRSRDHETRDCRSRPDFGFFHNEINDLRVSPKNPFSDEWNVYHEAVEEVEETVEDGEVPDKENYEEFLTTVYSLKEFKTMELRELLTDTLTARDNLDFYAPKLSAQVNISEDYARRNYDNGEEIINNAVRNSKMEVLNTIEAEKKDRFEEVTSYLSI